MDCQVNGAYLENDLNAYLGPNRSGFIGALEAARRTVERTPFFSGKHMQCLYEPGQRGGLSFDSSPM